MSAKNEKKGAEGWEIKGKEDGAGGEGGGQDAASACPFEPGREGRVFADSDSEFGIWKGEKT